jgi:hypothetical protein
MVIFRLVTNKAKHSSHNVAHHHLARLGRDEPPSHGLHPLNELQWVGFLAHRNDMTKQVGGCCSA